MLLLRGAAADDDASKKDFVSSTLLYRTEIYMIHPD